MRAWSGVFRVVVPFLLACAARSGDPSGPAAPAAQPGMTLVCSPIVPRYEQYSVSMNPTKNDICSVGGDGVLTLSVKGAPGDRLLLQLAGYHGAGSYPIDGASSVTFDNKTPGQGRSQSSANCKAAACDVTVTDTTATAAKGTPHHLGFTIRCAKVCDSDTHVCAGSGGTISWSGSADCRVP